MSGFALKTIVLNEHNTITHRAMLLTTGLLVVYHHTQVAMAAMTNST